MPTGLAEHETEGVVETIDVSLRLWSDAVALAPIVDELGERADILHVRGKPIPASGRAAPRHASRHYASIAAPRTSDWGQIGPWIARRLEAMNAHQEIATLIRSGRIEAVFWIALLAGRRIETNVPSPIAQDVVALGASIFIEDYTDLEDGNPRTWWLPERG